MTTSMDLHDLLPTDEEVEEYRRAGVHLSRPIVPEDLLDRALYGMERFYTGDHDRPFPGSTRYDDYDWTPAHGDGLRKNDYAWYQVRELEDLVRHPGIAATAARLAGAESIRLWHDQLLYKPPQVDGARGHVGWHTDRQYCSTCSSTDMLTAWVPLVDVDETIGTVQYVAGSHEWDEVEGLDFFEGDNDEQQQRFSQGREVELVTARLRRGQVAFHNCGVIHGSGPNLGDRVRQSVAIHLQPGENHYREVVGEDGEAGYHRNDDLVRRDASGRPDYADPRICPQLWP